MLMYTCMCLHTRKLMHTCTYIQVCSCVYLNTQYIHTNMFSYTIYMYTSILVYTHMHAYLATHIHMYLHVGHKQTSVDCCSCTYMHTSSKGHVHTWYMYTGMLVHIHAPWHAPMHTHTHNRTHTYVCGLPGMSVYRCIYMQEDSIKKNLCISARDYSICVPVWRSHGDEGIPIGQPKSAH